MQVITLVLAATAVGLTSSSVLGPHSLWHRNPATDEKQVSTKLTNVLRYRGGEETKTETTDKIKGCCIGIDLGTTYRYVDHFSFLAPFHRLTLPNNYLQLRGRMEKWQSGDMSQRTREQNHSVLRWLEL